MSVYDLDGIFGGNEAKTALQDALEHLPDEKHRKNCKARLIALLQRLADTAGIINKSHFNMEGNLPDGKHFFALKPHKKIRAYGWFLPGMFVISHYAYKNQNKLQKVDLEKVCANWNKVEKWRMK